MARKVFKIQYNRCATDDVDSPESHDVLLPGHLFQSMSVEFFETYLQNLSQLITKEFEKQKDRGLDISGTGALQSILSFGVNKLGNLGQNWKYLIATGNMRSVSGQGS